MFYYTAKSKYLPITHQIETEIEMTEGQCFTIVTKPASKRPLVLKVVKVSDQPFTSGTVHKVSEVDLNVEQF